MEALEPEASVVVLSHFGGRLLERSLASLDAQQGLAGLEVLIVACTEDSESAERYGARVVSRGSLIDLPERAMRAFDLCRGPYVLVLEDHAAVPVDWARRLIDSHVAGRAAVGGSVTLEAPASTTEWALYYSDFHPYLPAPRSGPASTLTVGNVSYRREALREIHDVLSSGYLEGPAHEALAERLGELWLDAGCAVTTVPRGPFLAALGEQSQLGRHFASVRIRFWGPAKRWLYALASPLLPAVFLARMARHAAGAPGVRISFIRSLPALLLLTLAWSWGELLGYVSGSPPRQIRLATRRATDGPVRELG